MDSLSLSFLCHCKDLCGVCGCNVNNGRWICIVRLCGFPDSWNTVYCVLRSPSVVRVLSLYHSLQEYVFLLQYTKLIVNGLWTEVLVWGDVFLSVFVKKEAGANWGVWRLLSIPISRIRISFDMACCSSVMVHSSDPWSMARFLLVSIESFPNMLVTSIEPYSSIGFPSEAREWVWALTTS